MANAKDFVVNILGDDKTSKAWDSFKANAGKAAAAAAAAFAGKEIGKALAANIESAALEDKVAASLGASAEEAERWGAAAAGAYSAAWGDTMEEASTAVESVVGNIRGMREASDSDIQATTEKALALAQAMGVDVAESTTTVGILMRNGLAADATQAFDLITAGLQKIPTSMRGEAMDALNEYSVNFAQLGLSGDQAMTMLVNASANGNIAIDKTGDALKEFTIRSTDMSTSSVAAYDALGLNAQDMSNKILAGGDTASAAFGQIVTGLQNITDPATKANTAIALFGTPIEDLGTAEIPAFLDALAGAQAGLGDTAGAADRMAEQLSSNPKARVEEMRRSFDQWKADLVGMPGPLGDVAVGVQAFGADAAALATTVGMGVIALQNMKWAQVGATASTVASKVATVAGTVATGAATAAQWLWNAALNANPIGVVITLVAALVAGLVWFFTQTEAGKAVIEAVWGGIQTAIGGVTSWWTDSAVPGLQSGWQAVTGFFSRGKDLVVGTMNTAGDVIKKVWSFSPLGLITGNWDAIIGFFKGIPGKVGSVLGGVGDAIAGAFKTPFNAVAKFWNGTVGQLSFTTPDWVPGIGGKGWSMPKIPLLADGGIVTQATLAMVGEGRGPEAVVPLDRIDQFLSNVNRGYDTDNGRQGRSVHIGTINTGADAKEILEEIDWHERVAEL